MDIKNRLANGSIVTIHVDAGDVPAPAAVDFPHGITVEGGITADLVNGDEVFTANFTITPEQIAALHSVSVTLVPGQGATKLVELVSALLFLDFQTTPWDNSSNGTLAIGIESEGTTPYTSVENGGSLLIGSTVPAYEVLLGYGTQPIAANNSISLSSTAAYADGDSPLKIRLKYRVHDLATF